MSKEDFTEVQIALSAIVAESIGKSNMEEKSKAELIDYVSVKIPATQDDDVEIFFRKEWDETAPEEKVKILNEDISRKQKLINAVNESNIDPSTWALLNVLITGVLKRAKTMRTKLMKVS